MSVATPWPLARRPWARSITVTSPSASSPSVTAETVYWRSSDSTPVASRIAPKIASTGPSPPASPTASKPSGIVMATVARGSRRGAGVHDLVGAALLEHAVLVDAGLVGERVATDHGLVRLHRVAGEPRDHAARARQLAGVEPGVEPVLVPARAQQHHDLLQRAVAGALADPVYRA